MLKFLEFFAGIGGFSLGFENAGMICVGQVEKDKACQKVLEYHYPNVDRWEDIKDVKAKQLPDADVWCGGFPCQDVSVAGKRAGLAGERSGLWFEFHRLLAECQPRIAVIENVPGLLSSNSGRDFETILQGLEECGYRIAWRTLDAQYFGVAQPRRRLFIVASLGDGCSAEILFEREGSAGDYATIDDQKDQSACYPFDTPSWWNGEMRSQTLDSVLYKKQALPEKSRFPAVIVPAWVECPDCEDYWCMLHGMHAFDCDCPDVDTWAEEELYPYAPSVLRFITPLECERLQGFPDGWTEGQSDSTRYRQLGNAVTVNVSEWIGKRIVKFW